MVGEPQNLIIAKHVDWDFVTFFIRMAPITLPVFACGLIVCFLVEKFKLFGYGAELPATVRQVLTDHDQKIALNGHKRESTTYCARLDWYLVNRRPCLPPR